MRWVRSRSGSTITVAHEFLRVWANPGNWRYDLFVPRRRSADCSPSTAARISVTRQPYKSATTTATGRHPLHAIYAIRRAWCGYAFIADYGSQ